MWCVKGLSFDWNELVPGDLASRRFDFLEVPRFRVAPDVLSLEQARHNWHRSTFCCAGSIATCFLRRRDLACI